MPLFYGRKTTSLTSFLFLYTLLIVKVRRLAWRERNMLFAMDGDNRRINNDESWNWRYKGCYKIDYIIQGNVTNLAIYLTIKL